MSVEALKDKFKRAYPLITEDIFEKHYPNVKEIPGFPGYFVTELGDVLSYRGLKMSPYTTKVGYQSIKLKSPDGSFKVRQVHRLMMLAYKPQSEASKLWVNHKDGDKLNNKLSNLEWTTPSQNHNHARDVLKRTWAKGEDSGNAKITEDVVRAVRILKNEGWSNDRLAALFLVSSATISYIHNGKRWAHLQ